MKKKTIEVPESWKDVTLRKYLELQETLKGFEGNEDAQTASLLYHLCGLEGKEILGLSTESYNTLKNTLLSFMNSDNESLQRIIRIGDEEWGFEPNLSRMSYGAYCDITKYNELGIDKNWAKIMSILYRKVVKRFGETYEIEPYKGVIDEAPFLDLDMSIHFGAYFFFVHLSMDLVNSTLNYSMKDQVDLPPNIKQILVKSGHLMQQSLNLREEIY